MLRIQKTENSKFKESEFVSKNKDLKSKVLGLKKSIQELKTQVKKRKDQKNQNLEIPKIQNFSEKLDGNFDLENFCDTTNTSLFDIEDDISSLTDEKLIQTPILSQKSKTKKTEIETVYEAEKEESDTESSEDSEEESGGGFIESLVMGIGMFFF